MPEFEQYLLDLRKKIKSPNWKQLAPAGVPENEATIFKNYKIFPAELLLEAPWNYKKDDDFKSEKLRNNIKRNGQIENIHVRELDTGYYEVVNGNHRLKDMRLLGKEFVFCYDHGKIMLDEAKRIAVETNETRFDTDDVKLAALLEELKNAFDDDDLDLTLPFTEEELDSLKDLLDDTGEIVIPDIAEDDFSDELSETPRTVYGDLIEFSIKENSNTIRRHRLLCGDSTNETDVLKLMNGKLAHLLHTDPPYNVNYAELNMSRSENRSKDWSQVYCAEWRDSMSDSDYKQFLTKFIALAKKNMIEWAHYYIWHATTYFRELLDAMDENEIPYDKVPIQWVKQVAPLSWARYKRKNEPCLFAGKGASNGSGSGSRWFGPNNEVNIWEINRDHTVNYVHPTQKPIALAARAINNSSKNGEIVLDLFLGSGTTMLASELLKRNCYGMEMEPAFCDAITKRMYQFCKENERELEINVNGVVQQIDYFQDA